jgi:hypothetical protein
MQIVPRHRRLFKKDITASHERLPWFWPKSVLATLDDLFVQFLVRMAHPCLHKFLPVF